MPFLKKLFDGCFLLKKYHRNAIPRATRTNKNEKIFPRQEQTKKIPIEQKKESKTIKQSANFFRIKNLPVLFKF